MNEKVTNFMGGIVLIMGLIVGCAGTNTGSPPNGPKSNQKPAPAAPTDMPSPATHETPTPSTPTIAEILPQPHDEVTNLLNRFLTINWVGRNLHVTLEPLLDEIFSDKEKTKEKLDEIRTVLSQVSQSYPQVYNQDTKARVDFLQAGIQSRERSWHYWKNPMDDLGKQ